MRDVGICAIPYNVYRHYDVMHISDVDIRLVASAYTVTEASVAAVEVCAEVFGSTSIGVTITVRLSTLPGNASTYSSITMKTF